MSDTDPKDGQSVVPAQTLPAQNGIQPTDTKSSPFKIVVDGKGGVSISPNEERVKKADDKKKMPRGSSAFRHA
jgi:hypothetical protein